MKGPSDFFVNNRVEIHYLTLSYLELLYLPLVLVSDESLRL